MLKAEVLFMGNIDKKRVLIIGPKFFNYEQEIVSELNVQGYLVDFIDDRLNLNLVLSGLLRLNLFANKIRDISSKKKILLLGDFYDVFVCISPEGSSEKFLEQCSSRSKYSVLYMWDSFKNKPLGQSVINIFDKIKSFDDNDVKLYGLEFLPLYYPNSYQNSEAARNKNILMLCSLHSNRLLILQELMRLDIKIEAQIYVKNILILLYFMLKGLVNLKMTKYLVFRSKSHRELANLYNSCGAVLDIAHPDQVGLTNRTFEVLATGTKLITSNVNIKSYPFYSEDQVFIYLPGNCNFGELESFLTQQRYQNIDVSEYSIQNFVSKLIK